MTVRSYPYPTAYEGSIPFTRSKTLFYLPLSHTKKRQQPSDYGLFVTLCHPSPPLVTIARRVWPRVWFDSKGPHHTRNR